MRFCFKLTGPGFLATALVFGASSEGTVRQVTSVVKTDPQTGRLVRTVVVKRAAVSQSVSAPAPAPEALNVAKVVEETAKSHDIDPLLVHSMIQVESAYNPYAVSPKGAEGLMQLIPSTARRFGVKNSFDLQQNVSGGVRYLRYLLDLFQDERLAVAAYNAGEKAVLRYGGIPPYRETRNYVSLVSKKYQNAKRTAQEAEPVDESVVEEAYRPVQEFVDADGRIHIRTY